VSIVQVLANPDEFDGKAVRLVGYLQLEFETYALWLHREDRMHALLPNRIDLEASASADKVEQVNERYALLEGTLSSSTREQRRSATCSRTSLAVSLGRRPSDAPNHSIQAGAISWRGLIQPLGTE
jgi:hypothetical protein